MSDLENKINEAKEIGPEENEFKENEFKENEPFKPSIKEIVWESVQTPAYIGLGAIAVYLTQRVVSPMSSIVTPFEDLLLASGFHAGYVSKRGRKGSKVAIAASFYPEVMLLAEEGDLKLAGLRTGFKLFLGVVAYSIGRMYPFFSSDSSSNTT